MRNLFEFYGITHPKRIKLIKNLLKESLSLSNKVVIDTIFQLFNLKNREYHYTAIDLFTYNYNRFSYEEIQQLYPLLNMQPW